jgi:glycerate 2-kinase
VSLADAKLREDAIACARAGIRAADPARLVRAALAEGIRDDLTSARSLRLLAVGKAACAMARAALDILPDVGEAVVITNDCEDDITNADVIIGGHPAPDAGSVRAGERALSLAHHAGNDEAILVLISGGGSALMALPVDGVSLDDLRATTSLLLRAGASITELNCVRKHIDRLKGGRLARAAQPARTIALVLSDVTGDALDTIASGPLEPDTTTYQDALDVLGGLRLNVQGSVPRAVSDHLERGARGEIPDSPRADDPCFNYVTTHVIGNVYTALDGARAEAERLGYVTEVSATRVTGEARDAGTALARRALGSRDEQHARPVCLLSGGETTVTVRGTGHGGRNQELALAAAIALDGAHGITIASIGTDGIDGPTDAAGAFADGSTIARARALSLDAQAALANNDAYPFFAALGDLIRTGPTGTNVTDLQIVLIA